MLTSFKLFLRSLKRNKLFSSINVLGLTAGLFASVLIFMYVQQEMSYDTFHAQGERIYRINETFIWGDDNPNLFSSTGPGVAYAIHQEIPEVEQVLRVHTPDLMPVRFKDGNEEKFFDDERLLAVDSNFFEVFSFPLIYGDPHTALDEPHSVVLSKQMATKYFGSDNPMGKLIDLGGGPVRKTYKVTGVVATEDLLSYIDFDLLVSLNSIDRVARSNWSWIWTMFETFIVVREGANMDAVRSKLNLLPEKYAHETLEIMGYTWEDYLAAGKEWKLYLQPFQDIHLYSNGIYNRISDVGDMKIVAALVGSAIFLLILSCINFINLSTAQFTTRAKDVALRKVLGGGKWSFIKRFFGESSAYSIVALLLTLALLFYLLPPINQSLGTSLSFSGMDIPALIGFLLVLISIISMLAGLYPYVFFNSFHPMAAMRGELNTGKRGLRARNAMLVTQYVLSFLLIISTVTIHKQLNYFLDADMGFEKENLLTVENVHWTSSPEKFAYEVSQIEGVVGTSVCDAVPLLISNGDQFIPDEPEAGSVPLNYSLGDENYVDLLKLNLVVGRAFDATYASDTAAVILNETAAHTIGWTVDESILNKKIENWSGRYHIIGVVSDFNFWSMHAPIEPYAIFHHQSNTNNGRPLNRVMVKTKSTNSELETIKKEIEKTWDKFAPARPYEQIVITDRLSEFYQTEERFGRVLSFFTVLTILIASLGLFGIVVFSLEQRLKEIGIRKVVGASVSSIIILFSKKYIKLLLLGFIIAVPAGYYFMNAWLSDFEYHITMSADIFFFSLVLLLMISLLISILQTSKSALMNPAEVLKDE